MSVTWYVDSHRDPVEWDSAVVNGKTQIDIYRLVSDDSNTRWPMEFLWAPQGSLVSSARILAATAETAQDAVPSGPTPSPALPGYDRVLVLDANEPVPPGTAQETVVVRRSPS